MPNLYLVKNFFIFNFLFGQPINFNGYLLYIIISSYVHNAAYTYVPMSYAIHFPTSNTDVFIAGIAFLQTHKHICNKVTVN